MIIADHDFTANFLNALGYEDQAMMRDVITDELARLIVEDKKDIVNILRNEGINVSIGDNNEKIGNYITSEIAKGNQSLLAEISNLIAKKRFDKQAALSTIFNASGKWKERRAAKKAKRQTKRGERQTARSERKVTRQQQRSEATSDESSERFWDKMKRSFGSEDVVGTSSVLIANALTGQYSKKSAQNQALLNERLRMQEMQNASKQRKKLKMWQKIAITGGSLALVGFVFALIVRKKSE